MVKPLNWCSLRDEPRSLRGRYLAKIRVGWLLITFLVSLSSPLSVSQAGSPPPQGNPVKINRSVDGSPTAGISGWPALSADGSSIAFSSQAGNLIANDGNTASDVFLYNTSNRAIELVSLTSEGAPANAASYRPAISANGRFIAYTSLASNLDVSDVNGLPDIYLRDLKNGSTLRISRAPDGSPANGWSDRAALSADGNSVLFTSTATNLVAGRAKHIRSVYLYDNNNKLLVPISSTDEDARATTISGDGRYIAFVAARGSSFQLLLHDRILNSTKPLALEIHTPHWEKYINELELSADGSMMALLINDTHSATIYLYYRQPGQLTKAASFKPILNQSTFRDLFAMPSDGRSLVYTTGKSIFEFDLESQTSRELVNFAGTPPSSTESEQVAVSSDGQIIAFQTKTNGNTNLYSLAQGGTKQPRSFISGWIQNELGYPISGLEVSDNKGHTTWTDAEGNFRFEQAIPGNYTISPIREGVAFSPTNSSVVASQAGSSGLSFVAYPGNIITEARKDIGMPYSLNRGCDSPLQECGGPFHGYYSGDCTDLVIDAYAEGVGFDIQLALDRDFMRNPRHYYRWRDARNAHDMWRYYSYTNQIIPPSESYLPGDIVFFDWEVDGVIDHVALVADVNNKGFPRTLIDAKGVTADNPSGLAGEFMWSPFDAAHTPGHTRWTGIRTSPDKLSNPRIPILIVSIDSPNVQLQLSDARGRKISSSSLNIPGGKYNPTEIGKIISVDQPLMASEWFFIELSSQVEASYRLGIQLVNAGLVTQHYPREGVIASGQSILIPVRLSLVDDEIKLNLDFSE